MTKRPGVTFAAQDSSDREAMQRARSRGGKKTTALRAVEKEFKRRARLEKTGTQ